MAWADGHIAKLAHGETVHFRPRGNSMTGKVNDGQLCTVEPLGDRVPVVGDMVLCRAKGNQYLHLVNHAASDLRPADRRCSVKQVDDPPMQLGVTQPLRQHGLEHESR